MPDHEDEFREILGYMLLNGGSVYGNYLANTPPFDLQVFLLMRGKYVQWREHDCKTEWYVTPAGLDFLKGGDDTSRK